jgi:eukaryotic-like serine/threonine-protein kinase
MAKAKVLFLASNPLEQSRLALDEEIRAITAQIRSADHREALELVSGWAVRPDDLQQLLLQHKPQVVHFSGHGTRDAEGSVTHPSIPTSGRDLTIRRADQVEQLVFMGEDGQPHPISKSALVDLFYVLRDNVRVVLLNACHSDAIAETLAEVIPCSIGMSGAISDDAAIAFATAFYRGLGFGRSIQEAFNLGKNALMILQIPEDHAPRLYSGKGAVEPTQVVLVGPSIVPSGRLAAGADRNRTAMIEKVRTIWITGFLQQSLFHETRVLLGLSERTHAVARPLDLLVKRPDQAERPLPTGTQVVDVYDTMDRSLLILGAPGSGKTTLLLELARDLLDRATHDSAHPIPVVFPLSTWGDSRKPLAAWLQEELNLRYDVPRAFAQGWVVNDQVLPLLDGLDEVEAEYRASCVQAINAFRQSHGLLPLVITSRTGDYEAVGAPLRLHGAILVRPLTREQVNSYLTELGHAGEPIRAALHDDPTFWELLDSPLLLNIVTAAYAGQTETPPLVSGTVEEWRDHVLGSYVNQMLRRRAAEHRYTPERTVRWLTWLADQMGKHGQTVFYLERLQRDWLHRKRLWATQGREQLSAIHVCTVLTSGLVGGLVAGLVWVPVIGLVEWLAMGAAALVRLLIVGLAVGLVLGLVAGQLSSKEIVCVETVRWSWRECWRSGSKILFAGLLIGIGAGSVVRLVFGLSGAGTLDARIWLNAGLFVALFAGLAGLVVGLFSGLTFSQIEARAIPNEGIRRSARNALFVALVYGLFGGLFVGLFVALFGRLVAGLIAGLTIGLGIGFISGLRAGGAACLKHFVIRFWLIRNGSIPWNYVRFLDYAAERILLRKVGGGYSFLHRMLWEYFAARYVEPLARRTPRLKPPARYVEPLVRGTSRLKPPAIEDE